MLADMMGVCIEKDDFGDLQPLVWAGCSCLRVRWGRLWVGQDGGNPRCSALDAVSVRWLLGIPAETLMEKPDFRSMTLWREFWAGDTKVGVVKER